MICLHTNIPCIDIFVMSEHVMMMYAHAFSLLECDIMAFAHTILLDTGAVLICTLTIL